MDDKFELSAEESFESESGLGSVFIRAMRSLLQEWIIWGSRR
jgi:hypothetical protein